VVLGDGVVDGGGEMWVGCLRLLCAVLVAVVVELWGNPGTTVANACISVYQNG